MNNLLSRRITRENQFIKFCLIFLRPKQLRLNFLDWGCPTQLSTHQQPSNVAWENTYSTV